MYWFICYHTVKSTYIRNQVNEFYIVMHWLSFPNLFHSLFYVKNMNKAYRIKNNFRLKWTDIQVMVPKFQCRYHPQTYFTPCSHPGSVSPEGPHRLIAISKLVCYTFIKNSSHCHGLNEYVISGLYCHLLVDILR